MDEDTLTPSSIRVPQSSGPTEQICAACDPECDGCHGPTSRDCFSCRAVNLHGECVAACPPLHFSDDKHACSACDRECALACRGPSATQCTGFNSTGCVHVKQGTVCVAACDAEKEYTGIDGICRACAPQCSSKGCTGPLSSQCNECLAVKLDGGCISACPPTHYQDLDRVCRPCDAQCTNVRGLSDD